MAIFPFVDVWCHTVAQSNNNHKSENITVTSSIVEELIAKTTSKRSDVQQTTVMYTKYM